MTPIETLARIRDEIEQTFVERGEVIEGALVALLSRSHVLLVGPPGTAKSMLADEICRRVGGAVYFQWLLTKFTTPEEVFGAVSLKGLESDEYRRVTTHKLPEAHVAFLDEVFKANSSILNSILTLVNERLFHNGRTIESVPLISLFGATNELPEEDELSALYDRFLLRFMVGYVKEDFRFLRMLEAPPAAQRTTLSLAALGELQEAARRLPVPPAVLRHLADVRRELGRKQIVASDRRYHHSLAVLRARALLAGRDAVAEEDLAYVLAELGAARLAGRRHGSFRSTKLATSSNGLRTIAGTTASAAGSPVTSSRNAFSFAGRPRISLRNPIGLGVWVSDASPA